MSRPAKAIIKLDALRANYQLAKDLTQGQVVAVVKADAYSHGAIQCAQALSRQADAFAVACIEEALELRKNGINHPIVILEGFFEPAEVDQIQYYQLDSVIHCHEQLAILERSRLTHPIRAWLKMDSGMGRVGFMPHEYRQVWQRLNAIEKVKDIVLMTHLACADEVGIRHTVEQLEVFEKATLGLPGERSIANSAGIVAFPRAHSQWNRPGLMLYGVSPFPNSHAIEQRLKPVMELRSRIISIKDIAVGSSVGYGSNWVASRATRLGIVAIGYGDGYPRHAKNNTPVWINGQRVPLVGRVSMDMITVDLTDLDNPCVGDGVVLWGEPLPIEEIARCADTIPHQLLCNLNRVPVAYSSVAHIQGTEDPVSESA
ncbi:alanine racemase [Candidatus Sororendozoicomonas aggregata]|uniref:alanine racemase n=1 Tax=Candidatus Sororendozoicomonas aggregata TaxID=3073239 RepID=UPI002ED66EA7